MESLVGPRHHEIVDQSEMEGIIMKLYIGLQIPVWRPGACHMVRAIVGRWSILKQEDLTFRRVCGTGGEQ